MKKLILTVIVFGGFIFSGINVVSAVEGEQAENQIIRTHQDRLPVLNDEGVCENYDGTQPGKGQGPGSYEGQGQCKGKGLRNGQGQGQGRRDGSGGGMNKGNGKQLRDGSGGNCDTGSK